MSPKKSNPLSDGESAKTPKVWEKARREKMKIYFNELQEVLPLYDPSSPMSRFEILQKSRSYIKELQNQNQDLLNGGFDEVYKTKMDKLKQRVKELLQRVDQLTDLLRRANIMIPPLVPCPDKQENLSLCQKWMNQRPKKWTEKINVVVPDEKIENILSLIKDFKKKNNVTKKSCKNYEKPSESKTQHGSVAKKPNFVERLEMKKKKHMKNVQSPKPCQAVADGSSNKEEKGNSETFTESQSPSHTKENLPVDFNLPLGEESSSSSCEKSGEKTESSDTGKTTSEKTIPPVEKQKAVETKTRAVGNGDKISIVTGKVKNVVEPQSNVFLPASTNVVQSNTYLLTNDGNLVQFPILNSTSNVFSANTNLLTQAAIVNQPNSGLLTPLVINRPSPVIVLQKPTPQIIQAAQIVNPTPQILSVPNQSIQIVGNSIVCTTSSPSSKTLPYILSKQPVNKKRIAKDSTMTTYVNKIPIPALSKQSYVKKTVGLNNAVGAKGKSIASKTKDPKEKSPSEEENKIDQKENGSEVVPNQNVMASGKSDERNVPQSDITDTEKSKESESDVAADDTVGQKRNGSPSQEETPAPKKQKVSDTQSRESDDNLFKPIENPVLSEPVQQTECDNLFCNLKLPNSMGHNISVSPTAAFLSTFPIVASSKFDEELSVKLDERREDKTSKTDDEDKSKRKETAAESLALTERADSHDKRCDLPEVRDVPLPTKEPAPPPAAAPEPPPPAPSIPLPPVPQPVDQSKEATNIPDKDLLVSTNNCDMNIVSNNISTNADDNTNSNNSNNSGSANVAAETNKTDNSSSSSSSTNANLCNNCSANSAINSGIVGSTNDCPQLLPAKTWDDYHQPKSCEVRTDPFYIHSDVQNSVPPPVLPDISNTVMATYQEPGANPYKNPYPQNNNIKTNFNVQNTISDQIALKNSQFDYGQNVNKRMNYNGDRNAPLKKPCSNVVNDVAPYGMLKHQPPMYQAEPPHNYHLTTPTKEMSTQRNSRPPVNWMTDPDVRTRSATYGSQVDKAPASKIPPFTQSDIFYMNNQNPKLQPDVPVDYPVADVSKLNYNKNDFYMNSKMVPDGQIKVTPDQQRCKNVEKRSDSKFPAKPPHQNASYNIFDYNYNGNYYGEDDVNKFCNVQNFQSNTVKTKKPSGNNTGMSKKKTDTPLHLMNPEQQPTNDAVKRPNPDQVISNHDYNPVANQECFSWVPGKNVEWLPGKSFVDTNMILPSTLPTLVGDLALGTTPSNDVAQTKANSRANQSKGGTAEPSAKSYIDIGLGNNTPFAKTVDSIPENNKNNNNNNNSNNNNSNNNANNKQYLEPFANLSKNIFDLTPSTNPQLPKSDCDKNGYLGNSNDTIVLKNIFELPVSKSFGNDFANRHKQRPVNNTQNTFLSVSQLVETPNYENSSIKGDGSMESGVANQAETYPQTYGSYHSGTQKSYKNKARNPQYKFNERKYHGYKNASSNYSAEALIRSNPNLSFQNNEFQPEINSSFYPGKNPQKTDSYPTSTNDHVPKADFIPCSTQNIYSDFNFSSPVPNFNIATSVASSDYVSHDTNFSAQNNTFFGDFIPPEYPITESVSNSLLLPPCSIALQNPFIIEKRNATLEKAKPPQGKHYTNSRSRKNFDCSKTNYSDFSIGHNPPASGGIFTNAPVSIACPNIFTSTTCQNLLPVPNQPDPNIAFSASSFTHGNITFPPLTATTTANANYHRATATATTSATLPHNSATFFPATCHSMFTTCSTTTVSSSRTCPSTVPAVSSANAVITTPFSVGNAPFPTSTQSALPFLSLSNPIIPPSVPSTSGNSLANFNLSTIFPEINQKGNYHYP